MNKAQKIIWTAYLLLIIFGLLRNSGTGYNRGDMLSATIIIGWLPFLIAHFIWTEKKENEIKESKPLSKFHNNFIIKILLTILYVAGTIFLTLIFVRLFYTSDFENSWKLTFLFSPYFGAIIMGFLAYRKGANWKWILLFAVLGLTTTDKIALISAISFYYLLGKDFKETQTRKEIIS